MKLQDLLNISEGGGSNASAANSLRASTSGTSDGAVAKYDKILSDEPVERLSKKHKVSFMKYATTDSCPGCRTIKEHGWEEVNQAPNKSKELVCQLCGKTHKR